MTTIYDYLCSIFKPEIQRRAFLFKLLNIFKYKKVFSEENFFTSLYMERRFFAYTRILFHDDRQSE